MVVWLLETLARSFPSLPLCSEAELLQMGAELPTELEAFRQFIDQQLGAGDVEMSPEEALEIWRFGHPDQGGLAESVLAVKQAIADMDAGDSGVPSEEFVERFRQKRSQPRDR